MENILKVVDVVDIGIEKEEMRRDFYDQVAKQFDDEEIKSLFTRLRDWENGHIKKFQAVRGTLESSAIVESYSGEMSAYMDALVDDKLYRKFTPENFEQHVKTPLEAIQTSIGFEKDAILLFMELLNYVQSDDKSIIMQLMDEERKHIVHLIKLRAKYTS